MSLDDHEARSHRFGPETEKWASDAVNQKIGITLRGCLSILRADGPMTDDQLGHRARALGLPMQHKSAKARRNDLENMQLVRWTGRHAVSDGGKQARLYEAIPLDEASPIRLSKDPRPEACETDEQAVRGAVHRMSRDLYSYHGREATMSELQVRIVAELCNPDSDIRKALQ